MSRINKKDRKAIKARRIENRKLCKRYPFLILCNWRTGKKDPRPYDFIWLDHMEPGWRKTFGIQMCEEIRQDLIKHNFLNKYYITQIKEKYGELRWYDGGIPIDSKVWDIIEKYSDISTHTCYVCGAPGKIINDDGWLVTMCPKCYKKFKESRNG